MMSTRVRFFGNCPRGTSGWCCLRGAYVQGNPVVVVREVLSLKASSLKDSLRVQRPACPSCHARSCQSMPRASTCPPRRPRHPKRQPSVSGEVGRFGDGGVSLEEFRGLSGQHRVGTSMELLGLSPGRSNGGRSGVGPPGVIRSPRIRHSRVQVVKGQLRR